MWEGTAIDMAATSCHSSPPLNTVHTYDRQGTTQHACAMVAIANRYSRTAAGLCEHTVAHSPCIHLPVCSAHLLTWKPEAGPHWVRGTVSLVGLPDICARINVCMVKRDFLALD